MQPHYLYFQYIQDTLDKAIITNRKQEDSYLEKYVIDSHKLLWLGGPPPSLHWLAHCLDEQQVPVDGMFELAVCEVVQQGL